MNWIKLKDDYIDLKQISYISEVVEMEFDDFYQIIYGFELVIGGELMPVQFSSKKEAQIAHDLLVQLRLTSEQVIDLDKMISEKLTKGEKND